MKNDVETCKSCVYCDRPVDDDAWPWCGFHSRELRQPGDGEHDELLLDICEDFHPTVEARTAQALERIAEAFTVDEVGGRELSVYARTVEA
jgi:hypothetical protein